jgi:hypothetical protein
MSRGRGRDALAMQVEFKNLAELATLPWFRLDDEGRLVLADRSIGPVLSSSSETTLDAVAPHEGLVGFCSVHPHGPDPIRKLDELVARGARGIKLHPNVLYHQAIGLAKVLMLTEGKRELRHEILFDNAARLLGFEA